MKKIATLLLLCMASTLFIPTAYAEEQKPRINKENTRKDSVGKSCRHLLVLILSINKVYFIVS